MPHRRTGKAGSFGGHFDELVKQFPHDARHLAREEAKLNSRELQEKLDIHALLFERAWRIDGREDRN